MRSSSSRHPEIAGAAETTDPVSVPKTPVDPAVLRRIKARPATRKDVAAWFARQMAAAPKASPTESSCI